MKECVSVCVTGPGLDKEKFLGDKMVEQGTGVEVRKAVESLIDEWGIRERIIALSYDTCSVNTGRDSGKLLSTFSFKTCESATSLIILMFHFSISTIGACVELERNTFKRALLRLPCFHHILELVLGGFIQHRWKTSGPRDALYARFQNEWPKIRQNMPDILSGAKDKVKITEDKVKKKTSYGSPNF